MKIILNDKEVKHIIHDAFCNGFLTTDHHVVDEFGHSQVVVLGIRKNFAFGDDSASWHLFLLCFRWSPESDPGALLGWASLVVRPRGDCWRGPLTSYVFLNAVLVNSQIDFYLGRLAPYLDRPWRRSETPEVSSVPRIMW